MSMFTLVVIVWGSVVVVKVLVGGQGLVARRMLNGSGGCRIPSVTIAVANTSTVIVMDSFRGGTLSQPELGCRAWWTTDL
jgi:hypothetical protein